MKNCVRLLKALGLVSLGAFVLVFIVLCFIPNGLSQASQWIQSLGGIADVRVANPIPNGNTLVRDAANGWWTNGTVTASSTNTSVGINGTLLSPPNFQDSTNLLYKVSGTNAQGVVTNVSPTQLTGVIPTNQLATTLVNSDRATTFTATQNGTTFNGTTAMQLNGTNLYGIAAAGSIGITTNGGVVVVRTTVGVVDTAYSSAWDAVTTNAPTENAVYDILHSYDQNDDGRVDNLDNLVTQGSGANSTIQTTYNVSGTDTTLITGSGSQTYSGVFNAQGGLQFNGTNVYGIEAGSNITISTNGGRVVITGSAGGGASSSNLSFNGVLPSNPPNITNTSTLVWGVSGTNALGYPTNLIDNQIVSITTRSKLPSAIAYEDENNSFSGSNIVTGPLRVSGSYQWGWTDLGASTNITGATNAIFKILTGNLILTNAINDNESVRLQVNQDATGSRTLQIDNVTVWIDTTNQSSTMPSIDTNPGRFSIVDVWRENGTNYGSVMTSPSVFSDRLLKLSSSGGQLIGFNTNDANPSVITMGPNTVISNGVLYAYGTGGGGAGTVTATGGALTANSVVLGAGGTDTKVVAGIISDGTSKITLGVGGTSVGGITVSNATSGRITILPPTGALGSRDITWPLGSGTLANLDNTAFASSWNGDSSASASRDALYDYFHLMSPADNGKVRLLDNISAAGFPYTDSSGNVQGTRSMVAAASAVINIVNGDGASGNPTFDWASTKVHNATWSDGTTAGFTNIYDLSGTDVTNIITSGLFEFRNTVRVSTLTASQTVATDSSTNLVSVANSGTGGYQLTSGATSTNQTLNNPSFVSATIDASSANVTLKQTKYLVFKRPDYGDGAGAIPQTNSYVASGLMHFTMNGTADTNANFIVYEGIVPQDIDTSVAMTAKFSWIGGGTDTDDYAYDISYGLGVAGSAWPPAMTSGYTRITTTPVTPAANDLQQSAATTLTGWAASMTAGTPISIKVARVNNAQDDTARDDTLVIAYGSTQ